MAAKRVGSDLYGLGTIAGTMNIYTLHEPENERLRYIGITRVTLPLRLQRHLDKVNDYSHRCSWLAKLKQKQLRPQIKLLGKAPDLTTACWWERFFIATARHFEFDLVNSSGGGDGVYSPTEETRRKMSEAAKRRFANPEERQRNREAQKVAQNRPEVRVKKRQAGLQQIQVERTQEWREKHQAGVMASQEKRTASLRAAVTEEFRKRIGKLSAARWADPEYKKQVTAAIRASNPGRPKVQSCL